MTTTTESRGRRAKRTKATPVRLTPSWSAPTTLALGFVLAVMSVHAAAKISGRIEFELLAAVASAALLFRPAWLRKPLLWGCFAVVFAWLAYSHAAAANHTYLLAYLGLGLALSTSLATETDRLAACATNARWLLVAVMSFAVLQKGLSADFRDGSYLSYLVLTGGVGQLAWEAGAGPETYRVLRGNIAREEEFTPTSENYRQAQVTFENPFGDWLPTMVAVLAIGIIVAEGAIAVCFAFASHQPWSHALLLSFAGSLVLIRPEVMFISVLAGVGALISQRWYPRATLAYIALGLITLGLSLAGVATRLDGV